LFLFFMVNNLMQLKGFNDHYLTITFLTNAK